MAGGGVLADRREGPQPVALVEGQPELPQHVRCGQAAVGEQRGQVGTGGAVRKNAQQ